MRESTSSPEKTHRDLAEACGQKSQALDRRHYRLSMLSLVLIVAGVALIGAGVSQSEVTLTSVGCAALLLFIFVRMVLLRTERDRDAAAERERLHLRHLARLSEEWQTFTEHGDGLVDDAHDYAHDIDLVGPASLYTRIDTTHTVEGAKTLATWLGTASPTSEIEARQAAVAELASNVDFRVELEASLRHAGGDEKLDVAPFLKFCERSPSILGRPLLVTLIHVLPLVLLTLLGLWQAGVIGRAYFWLGLLVQGIVVLVAGARTKEALDLVSARRGYLEAFRTALLLIEGESPQSRLLSELKQKTFVAGQAPSTYFAILNRWAGLSELRTQFPINIFANFMLLWDLHVLLRLEKWAAQIGRDLDGVFSALGSVEALSSLATLHYLEPTSSFPELAQEGGAFVGESMGHPLLTADERIDNSLSLPSQGSAFIVTGSNMAGKSTLLRTIGLNVALGLAGGPVIAKRMVLPPVRLRASMRARDSLQRGASYFHAELSKLRSVVTDSEASPPVFFLLDELLRGTNARARHLGARAVVTHLLKRNAYGVVATHDIALSEMESEGDFDIRNIHFTDVMRGNDMEFDYRLRPGVVKTSNALRLLQMAGIDIDADDKLFDPPAAAASEEP